MEFKNTDRLLKLKFLGQHRREAKAEYLKHTLKTWYVFMREGSHFRAVGKPMFIERNFDETQFISLCEQEAIDEHAAADESKWVYQEVHWNSDKTSNHCSLDAAVRMLRLKYF